MEAILPIATVVGPFILLAVIVYAWARNRKTSDRLDRKAERGARELRRDLEEEQERKVDL
ncbi:MULTISPECIES: hypothetical protein [unclassified Erythrobacter]|jgi:hypothetical protein|uniref:hypothetical protein n=1 Tax=Erythrobacteraceae TaxID=335929 RepID=UPI00076D2EC3|nr:MULTISPECIES: hypothetical protein [unclassified Erythrobacter]KWV95588.1 hypothetical protein ASS64_15535 [Erythrobacter sp. AP23]MBO6525575.1 hypothetical protein [Erythrobacter sp.]MBO6529752.1 hypothetical protein [Erythrobacter sp.]MBO6766733.1 hypothetical protein [Erythrobacter sp.]